MTDDHQRAGAFDAWIGKTRTLHDEVTAFPVKALAATLDRAGIDAVAGTPVPPLWHWLYFLPAHRPQETRRDGHPKGDEFLPPIPLPRRVWAGSKFTWNTSNPLRIGDQVTRASRIESITPKVGKGGDLVFVKTVHEFQNGAGLSLLNEHQSAYREEAKEGSATSSPVLCETGATWHRELVPDALLLFRYSALLFNSHRIHYDEPYTTGEERYPGLVVQGPLIATLLMDLLDRNAPDAVVRSLEFKAVRPSFVDRKLVLRGQPDGAKVRLWASDEDNRLAMTATAEIQR
jgi:3-methylfumaryl-CoA hydratase